MKEVVSPVLTSMSSITMVSDLEKKQTKLNETIKKALFRSQLSHSHTTQENKRNLFT
jgi:hypothetical protein